LTLSLTRAILGGMVKQTPQVGIPVKLRKGMLQLSARQVQHVTAVKKLKLDDNDPNGPMTQADIDGEGGYWIKTDYTHGEWWAWILFRVA
jgi:hypothetical protein